MASVTVIIPNTSWSVTTTVVQWAPGVGVDFVSLGSILAATPGQELFLGRLTIPRAASSSSSMSLQLAPMNAGTFPSTAGPEFSTQMETSGTITLVASDSETLVLTGIDDATEPYVWSPSNASELRAFADHLAGLLDRSLTVTFDDNATSPLVTLESQTLSVAATLSQATLAIGSAVGVTLESQTLEVSATLSQPTLSIGTVGSLLTLADWDDSNLDVDAAALLEASAPGTTGNNPYADSDRGGTDSPIDGELGLSSTDTLISRIRRHSATELNLNDNDSPSALSIGAYFDAGGDGNDLTLYLQTSADGLVSFAVSTQLVNFGGNYARFTLPADAQTLLDNLSTGDLFIFALARPESSTIATVTLISQTLAVVVTLSQPTLAGGTTSESVTVDLTGVSVLDDYIRWSDDQSLGSTFAANGLEQVLSLVDLNNANPPGRVRISITGLNNDFTPEFEANGQLIFEASDGELLEVMIADADMTEIYQWEPANSAEVVAFVLHVKSLLDQSGTLTLRGESTATPTTPTTVTLESQTLSVVATISQPTLAIGAAGAHTLSSQTLSVVAALSRSTLVIGTAGVTSLRSRKLSIEATISQSSLVIGVVSGVTLEAQTLSIAATISQPSLSIGAVVVSDVVLEAQTLSVEVTLSSPTIDKGSVASSLKITSDGLERIAQVVMNDCDYTAVGVGQTTPTVGDMVLENEVYRSEVSQRISAGNRCQVRTLHRNDALPTTLYELGVFMNDESGDSDSGELLIRALEKFTKGNSDLLSVFEFTFEED